MESVSIDNRDIKASDVRAREDMVSDIKTEPNSTEQNSTDREDPNAICDYAFYGEVPDGVTLSIPGRALYLAVSDLYRLFRDGRISAQTGADRKRRAIRQYQIDTTRIETDRQLVLNHADFWKRVEAAANRYAVNRAKLYHPELLISEAYRVIASADEFYRAVYGIEPTLIAPIETQKSEQITPLSANNGTVSDSTEPPEQNRTAPNNPTQRGGEQNES